MQSLQDEGPPVLQVATIPIAVVGGMREARLPEWSASARGEGQGVTRTSEPISGQFASCDTLRPAS